MEVYEFNKCLLDRLEESMNVLSWKDYMIKASQVRKEWAYFIELQIEPTGWQAVWKIPRVICEELHVCFPTVVFGVVEQVIFKEMKAVFVVLAVQDEDVHLPERHEVALEDLWPTISQENSELNAERTADCLDRLRFFYTQVWMPWDVDNDDDLNWVDKHLESRIRFCYDLRKRSIKRPLAAHIRMLLTEARYIQQRREYFELGLSDDEGLDDTLDKSQITDLMRLHLRLAMIRSEIEMLENPEMRRIYEEIHFDNGTCLKDVGLSKKSRKVPTQCVCYVVTLIGSLEQQINLLNIAKKRIEIDCIVQICSSLQNVLSMCSSADKIFLSPGRHSIKFLEYLNGDGIISGLTENKYPDNTLKSEAVIMSADDDSILLVFDGDFTFEHIVFDCKNIRTGIIVKNGKVNFRNCRFIGNIKSSTQQGIVCAGNAETILEDCIIENFATGIILNKESCLTFHTCKILNCRIGVELNAVNTKVYSKDSSICGSKKCAIHMEANFLKEDNNRMIILKQLHDIEKHTNTTAWHGDCTFDDCKENICLMNHSKALISENTLKLIFGDDEVFNTQVKPNSDIDLSNN